MSKLFDFVIYGDSFAEGLLIAASLAKKKYRVGLVRSHDLGELPSQSPLPQELPDRLDEKTGLNDFLFQAGFFQLEESGLGAKPKRHQVIVPKHRLSFDGLSERWRKEVFREFPQFAERLVQARKSLEKKQGQTLQGLSAQLESWSKQDPDFGHWIALDAGGARPEYFLNDSSKKALLKSWAQYLAFEKQQIYEARKDLETPFLESLVQHCVKLGVVLTEPASYELKKTFLGWQFSSEVRSKRVVINSLAGLRQWVQLDQKESSNLFSHWHYFERIECAIEKIPEPLDRFCAMSIEYQGQNIPMNLLVERDRLRDQALLTVGVWLPFEEKSADWIEILERSREQLRRLLPFVPEASWKDFPSRLELNEMKGEAVRRGEVDRLCFQPLRKLRKFGARKKTRFFASRHFLAMPYVVPGRFSHQTWRESYEFTQEFEKKKNARA